MTGYFAARFFALHLADLAPMFTARPGTEKEFHRPNGWQHTPLENSVKAVQDQPEGHALMALMGGPVAVVDVDTKNGADTDAVRALLDGIGVRIYGDILTPSGGRHFYVAGHPDLPTVHAQEGKDGLLGYPGTEIISFGANVFVPGTLRPKYQGKGYTVMLDDLEALADGGDPDAAEALAGWVAEHRVRKAEEFEVAEPWSGAPPDARQAAYLNAVLKNTYERISVMGKDSGRNVAIYNAAMCCGNYIAGAGMNQDDVVTMLTEAGRACGLAAEDGEESIKASIASGLKNGKQRPRAVPEPPSVTQLVADADGVVEHHGNSSTLDQMEADYAFAREVELEARKIRVRAAALDKVAAEKEKDEPPFDAGTLAEILARPDEPPHRIEDLVPSGASALIVAQKKTGKTTLVLNLARCLIEGGDLLGRFATRPITGRVAILNYEVTGKMLSGWAKEVGVPRDRLVLVNLRGRRNPLRHAEDKTKLATLLRSHEVEALIVDPFGRAYGGKSQNDAAEVGGWLVDLDAFARSDVGAAEVYLCAHAGWTAERTRGSSALEDWPDVTITMTRDKDNAQVRYLAAEGRDVLVEEDRLDFDPVTRQLSLSGAGSRRQAKAVEKRATLVTALVEAVAEKPGLNTTELGNLLRQQGVAFQRGEVGQAARDATTSGHLRQEHGPRNSILYFPRGSAIPTYPNPSQRDSSSYPDPSLVGRDSSEDGSRLSSPEIEGTAS